MSLTGITLPSIYIDLVEESTFSGLLVANEHPERDSVGADSSGAFRLDVLCTNGNNVDLAATDVYVEGVQAYDGGTSSWINSFTGTITRLQVSSPLLVDWRMELSGVSSWTAGNSATLTKQTGNPAGFASGIQVLRVAYNGTADPSAYQSVLSIGQDYRVRGWARGDGTANPEVYDGATQLWAGTSSTTWQQFDETFTATAALCHLTAIASAAGYCEFDNVVLEELGPDYRFEGQAPAAWASEQVITIRVVSADDGGPIDTLDQSYDFTVEDTVAPTVISVVARDHETLRVTFSEGMAATSATASKSAINPASYSLEFVPADEYEAAVWAVISSASVVSAAVYDLVVDMPLTFNKTYQLTCNVEDDSGVDIDVLANSATFTSWQPPGWERVHCPDFYEYFSEKARERDEGDLQRLCSVVQDQWEYMVWDAYRFPADTFDHVTAPEQEIDRMLADAGNPFDFDLDVDEKRYLLELLPRLYGLKGTETGIRALADFFTNITITDVRPFTEACWIMGVSYLGTGTYLGPSIQRNLYSFDVIVNTELTDAQRNKLARLIDYEKVAHEHAYIVEPTDPEFIDHWSLGLSYLGLNTLLH